MGEYSLDPCVEGELWSIWDFIAGDKPDAASRVIEAAYATFKDLAANPGMGRLRRFRSPRLKEIRSWRVSGFKNYLIFYRVVPGGIQALHVYHGAQDLESLFTED